MERNTETQLIRRGRLTIRWESGERTSNILLLMKSLCMEAR